MTPAEKIKILAKLAGRDYCPLDKGIDEDNECRRCGAKYHNIVHSEPTYFISYDAIIPLIQKQPHKIQLKVRDLCGNPLICKSHFQESPVSPEQLANALLQAVSKN